MSERHYNKTRYIELFKLLKEHDLFMTDVARLAGCTKQNVRHFMTGHTNSIRVARAFVQATSEVRAISEITGYSRAELQKQEAA